MVMTPSQMLPLGTPAPAFRLPDTAGRVVALYDTQAPAHVIVFMCNHCPFVVHLRSALAELGRTCVANGVAMYAINSNDVVKYPADNPEKMRAEVAEQGYTFPYLFDETQEVAKAYRAACTPDFYIFDRDYKLVYRGQFDASRPSNGVAVTGDDLKGALQAVLEGRAVNPDQTPSIGCNIKWKPGNAPDYFG